MRSSGAVLFALLVIATPSIVRAGDLVQVSSRLVLGGGAEFPATRDPGGLFELGLRGEALFGDPDAERLRLGPALDVRTANFGTLELAGGAMGLVPLGSDFALTLTLGAGYAFRDQGRDGALGLATIAVGYRPYDHFDAYALGIALYVSGRAGLTGWETWEVTAGLEIDLELLFVTPAMFIITALGGHDPDEPVEPSEPARE